MMTKRAQDMSDTSRAQQIATSMATHGNTPQKKEGDASQAFGDSRSEMGRGSRCAMS